MTEASAAGPQQEKTQKIYQKALDRYEKKPDWVVFFREILGVKGVVRRLFTEPEQLRAFERTPEYRQILQMMLRLRRDKGDQTPEPQRVITIRLPKSLHESLRLEAQMYNTSMNQLCISKLLQMLDEELEETLEP